MIKYKDFSIKTKLFTLTIIPLIFIIILSSLFIYKEYKNKNEYSTLKQLIKVDSNISLLLHEIQKERGMSVGYIGSNAKEFKNKLIRQREKTNNQIENFEDSFKNLNKDDLSTHSLEIVNNVFDEFRSLQNIRNRIDNLELSTKKALNYYTLINSLLLDFIARTSSLSHDTSTTKEILSFYNFLMTKEKAGIERAIGASTLAKGSFQDDMFSEFTSLISTQNQYLKQFRTYAIDEHLNYVDNKLKDNSINEVQKIRDILTNSQKKLKLIILMQENIGYGGIIHDFKNFVLRKDFKYKNRVENKYKTLKELIKKYKNDFFISNRELKLLNRIEAVFKEYYTGLNVIENSIFKNVNTTQIDKLVKVDDTPAIEAIHELKNKQFDIKSTVWFDTISKKIEILKQIDDYLSKELSTKVANKYDSVSTYFYINVIVLIIALIVIFLLTALIYTNISKSAKSIYTGIERFMRYLNREINEIKDIEIHGNDEFGKIAEMANKNMKRINDDLEEDMLCVGEAILVLNRMREGYFNCRIKSTAANPQIQTFVYSVNKTLDIQKALFDEILQTLNSYTNYDYTKSIINQEIKGDMAKLLEGINSLKESITQMLLKNQDVGLTLKSSSGVLLKNVDILNKSSNDAAVKLEETVAALDEISGNITSTNINVKQMSQNAKILTNSSTEGKNLANQTTESMEEINRQVEAINEAITLIDQISFQTNILSLNAAVEAATAGEAGKGFAVVAQEVRNLASRSAEAANKIKQIVENATEKSAEGKTIASSMIEGYNRLNENVQKTVSLIENIQSASAEQTEGINQINDALNSLDKQTQQNANVATQTNDIAHEASNIAKSVVKNVKKNNFKGKLEDL